MPTKRLPKRTRVRTPPSKHIRRSNHLLSLALIILVAGSVATAGVHFLSASNAASRPQQSGSTDVSAPTVAFTAPTVSSISGTSTTVSVTAADETDGSGVVTVAVYIDNAPIAVKTFTGVGPYSFNWDPATVGKGSHTLSAVATDKAGNAGTALLTITVN